MKILNSIASIVILVGIGLIVYGVWGLKYDPSDAIASIHGYLTKMYIGFISLIIGFSLKGFAVAGLKEQQETERHKELIDAINKSKKGD